MAAEADALFIGGFLSALQPECLSSVPLPVADVANGVLAG
jgi:hypothetical protein